MSLISCHHQSEDEDEGTLLFLAREGMSSEGKGKSQGHIVIIESMKVRTCCQGHSVFIIEREREREMVHCGQGGGEGTNVVRMAQ